MDAAVLINGQLILKPTFTQIESETLHNLDWILSKFVVFVFRYRVKVDKIDNNEHKLTNKFEELALVEPIGLELVRAVSMLPMWLRSMFVLLVWLRLVSAMKSVSLFLLALIRSDLQSAMM